MITAAEALDAFKKGILDKISDLAKMEAVNEITQDAATAESECARGLRLAKDAAERGEREINNIFGLG